MEHAFPRGFASDNNSGVLPEVMEALQQANTGHAVGYGDDDITRQAIALIKEHFGPQAKPYFVFTGTAANVLSIASVCRSYHSVLCASTAHIHVDECGAPERFTGCKLETIATQNGKLKPDILDKFLHGVGFEHHVQPKLISISQSTELGTVYTPDEIRALSEFAHAHHMYLHVDGARLANAAASLNLPFKAFTTDAGVDIVSFGGTKCGLMAAESVVFLNDTLDADFKYIRKQGMQLISKMRFVSAQFIAYLSNNLWQKAAQHANTMAQELAEKLQQFPQITTTQPVQSNGVFAIVPRHIIAPLQNEYFFYVWDESTNEVRWMTSFDTTREDIDGFINVLSSLLD